MAETFTRRISIYVDSGQAQAAYDQLVQKQQTLTAKTQEYLNKGKEVPEKLTKQLQSVNDALDRQSKKISGELAPSLKDLRATYERLNRELNSMSKQDAGFAKKKAETIAAKNALDNYKMSLAGVREGFAKMLQEAKGVAFGVLIGNGAQAAVETILGAVRSFFTLKNEFDSSLRNLSAITGASGADLEFLRKSAIDLSKTGSRSAKEYVEAMKLIGSAKPELLESKKDLVEVTKAANLLAKASGLDLPDAATRLTDALNQFGAPASDAAKFVDALAAASKYGAAEVPQVTEALIQFGAQAKSSNIDIFESSAAIELLAEKGIKGAEAGTKLRNVFLTLSAVDALPAEALAALQQAGVNTAILTDKSLSLQERLTELSKVTGNSAAMVKLFDKQNVIAGQIILENLPRLQQLTGQIKETGVASEQASVNVGGFGNAWSKLLNVVSARLLDIDLSGLGNSINMLTDLIDKQKTEAEVLEDVRAEMNLNLNALKSSNLEGAARSQLIGEINSKYGDYLPNLLTEKSTLDEINKAQEAGNKLIQTKIFSMAYEEELTALLKEQAAAQRMMVEEQIRRAKMQGMGFGDATGLSAAQVEAQRKASEAFEKANKNIADSTGKRVDDLKAKYKQLAEVAQLSFNAITGGGGSVTSGGDAPAGGSSPGNARAAAEKKVSDIIKQLRHELLLDQLSADAKEIQQVRDKYAEKRAILTAEAAKTGQDITIELDLLNRSEAMAIAEVTEKYKVKYDEIATSAEESFKRVEAAAAFASNPDFKTQFTKGLEGIKDEFQTVMEVLQSAATFMGTVFQIMDQEEQKALAKDEKYNKEKLENLQERLQNGRISQKAYNREVERIEKEAEKKRKEVVEKQFKRNKAIQITMAAINTASAVMNALSTSGNIYAGIALAAMAAATGAAQIALIAKSEPPEYETGTEAWRAGIGGDKHSDSSRGNPILDGSTGRVLGRVEEGEAFIPADSTAANQGAIRWMIANRGKPLPRFSNSLSEYAGGTAWWMNQKGAPQLPAQVFDDYRSTGTGGVPWWKGQKGAPQLPAHVFDEIMKRMSRPAKVVFVKDDYDRFNQRVDYVNTRTSFDN